MKAITNLHLSFWMLQHKEDTTKGTMAVYHAHPAHDGLLQMWIDFELGTDEQGDIGFTYGKAEPNKIHTQFIDPCMLQQAMELVLDALGGGTVARIESGLVLSADMVK